MNPITAKEIAEMYIDGDVCAGELLASIPADGLNLEAAFELYIDVKKHIDGDRFFKIIMDEEQVEL